MQPELIRTEHELDDLLSTPTPGVIADLAQLDGDLLILGVGGKMGPTIARMAARAFQESGKGDSVLGVSRFSNAALRKQLESVGVQTIASDLLGPGALEALPDAPNVLFMAGRKFGSTGSEWLTWAMNTYLPGRVAERFVDSKIVVFSTGNVYPLVPVDSGGATEETTPQPIGEYAQSCLGRERMFQHFSESQGTLVCLLRLNYAIDLRYGVLLDIGQKVWLNQPIVLTMGHVNVVWQGDANAVALRAFGQCASPAVFLNVAGPDILTVRSVAEQFGNLLGRKPVFQGEEASTALLNNASRSHQLLGPPQVSAQQMLRWIAHWIQSSGSTLSKPTHFEQRDGRF